MTSRFQVVPAAYVLCLRQQRGSRGKEAGTGGKEPDTEGKDPGTQGKEPGTEVLLQLRRNTGYRDGHWACAAAGHIEAGESARQAAVREAGEELGIRIDPSDLSPLTAMHRTHGNGQVIDERADFFFTCRTWAGAPRRMEPGKAADLGWYPLDGLPHPVVPHEELVLQLLHDGEVPAFVTFGFDSAPPNG